MKKTLKVTIEMTKRRHSNLVLVVRNKGVGKKVSEETSYKRAFTAKMKEGLSEPLFKEFEERLNAQVKTEDFDSRLKELQEILNGKI